MTPERWKRIDALFNGASEIENAAEREQYLDRECGGDLELKSDVLVLLASDDQVQTGFVQGRIEESIVSFGEAETILMDRRAGPYKLTRELGRGGMGTVYLGERSDGQYDGEVAVKLVRPGMDTDFFLTRFKRERQALARLQHPNIARLLDSGITADGMPYIVMERVNGKPINAYCRDNGLAAKEILDLFLHVGAAVAHAHRNFVVHRDLKPGNILVEDNGAVKLLDFGICKLLLGGGAVSTGDTVETANMMTPDYASPEQVRGDAITIASDVYSLGAVLYELLTGKRPHRIEKLTPQGLLQAICESEPIPPSAAVTDRSAARALSGDLDTIILKAMQKDPQRRYVSVEQFTEDLRRVLNDEPVLARPDTAAYRMAKFIRRHRTAVAVSAAIVVTLSSGVVAYARQADAARLQSAEARTLANAMMFDIHDQVKDLPGALKVRENIVRTGLGYLDRLAALTAQDPSLRLELAAAYLRMGDVQGAVIGSHTGDSAGALASFRKGLKTIQSMPATSVPAGLLRMDIHRRIGQLQDERAVAKESLEEFDSGLASGVPMLQRHPDDISILNRVSALYRAKALMLRQQNETKAASESCLEAEKHLRRIVELDPRNREARLDLASNQSITGTLLQRLGDLKGARAQFEGAVKEWDEIVREDPTSRYSMRERMLAYSHLGDVLGNPNYENLKDPKDAMEAFRNMLDAARATYTSNPGDQGATIDYGMALARAAAVPAGELDDRINLYQRAAGLLNEALQRDRDNGTVRANLASQKEIYGDLMVVNGRLAEARASYIEAIGVVDASANRIPASLRVQLTSLQKLAEDSARRGNAAEALAFARRGVQIGESVPALPAPTATLRPRSYAAMGNVLELLQNRTEARRWRERALDGFRKLEHEKDFTAQHRRMLKDVEELLAKP